MKLAELGLKTKPETKYFAGGYIAFSTIKNELHYKAFRVTKDIQYDMFGGVVPDKEHLNLLLNTKNTDDLMEFLGHE